MFKNLLFIILCLVLSQASLAKIEQLNEESLNQDLGFRLDQESEDERQIASDDEQNEKESEDSERDIASENEELDAPIRYWKY